MNRIGLSRSDEPDIPEWLAQVLRNLRELQDLPENWNSYGARCVDPRAIQIADRILRTSMTANTPTPTIIPTNQGGVDFEWETDSVFLLIRVMPSGCIHFNRESTLDHAESEGDISLDWAPLETMIRELSASPTGA